MKHAYYLLVIINMLLNSTTLFAQPSLAVTLTTTLTEPTATNYNQFGAGVEGVGDVNRDGYGDVVVGANQTSNLRGRAYLYLGSQTGINTVTGPAQTIYAPSATDNYFGGDVAKAGDVNGDGYADVLISSVGANGSKGYVYLYLGSSTGLLLATGTFQTIMEPNATSGNQFGYSIAGAGDVNRDGYADVLIGNAPSSGSSLGRAYLYLGSSTGLNITNGPFQTLSNPVSAATSLFGSSVAAAGDVNQDGYADVLVGDGGGFTPGARGKAYLYLGSRTGLLANAYQVISEPNPTANTNFGLKVAGVGDINGDSYDDVLVSAPAATNNQGTVYVFFGHATGLSTVPDLLIADPLATQGDYFGSVITGGGDVNGDGYADVLVGASESLNAQGRAYVYLGNNTGLSTLPTTMLASPMATPGDYFGSSLADAGDIDGDGYADVLIGAYGTNNAQGRVYLYSGQPNSPLARKAGTASIVALYPNPAHGTMRWSS